MERDGHVWRSAPREAPRSRPSCRGGSPDLRLAARVADGIIVGLGLTLDVVRLCREHIEAGAREAGRRVEDIDVWWLVKSNVAESRAAGLEPIKMALAASANHAFRFTLEGKGLGEDLHEQVRGRRRQNMSPIITRSWAPPPTPGSPTAGADRLSRRPLRHRLHAGGMRGGRAQRGCRRRLPASARGLRPRAAPVHPALGTGSGAAGRRGGRSPMSLVSERMTSRTTRRPSSSSTKGGSDRASRWCFPPRAGGGLIAYAGRDPQESLGPAPPKAGRPPSRSLPSTR